MLQVPRDYEIIIEELNFFRFEYCLHLIARVLERLDHCLVGLIVKEVVHKVGELLYQEAGFALAVVVQNGCTQAVEKTALEPRAILLAECLRVAEER